MMNDKGLMKNAIDLAPVCVASPWNPVNRPEFEGGSTHSAAVSVPLDPASSLTIQQVMHDVRGDLVTLAVMAKLLLNGRYGLLPAGVKKQIEAMERKANTTAWLAESYCRMAAAADDGDLQFDETIDMHRDVILPVAMELSLEIESKEIDLKDCSTSYARQHCLVNGNRLLLQGVIRTIFQNAVRHCIRRGIISYGIERRLDGHLGIFVSNNGATVPEQLRQRIFDKFMTIPPAESSAANGLGMGLYLARTVINKHGGNIWYEAEPRGSKFAMTLPAASEN